VLQRFSIIQSLVFLLILVAANLSAQDKHRLQLIRVDKGNAVAENLFLNEKDFINADECTNYIKKDVLAFLQEKGYLAASIDSIAVYPQKTIAWVYLGSKYTWGFIAIDSSLLAVGKWQQPLPKFLKSHPLNPVEFLSAKEQMLQHLENNGYPFAAISFDSSYFDGAALNARLHVFKGPLYHIDSISIEGGLRIQKNFLEKYLDIPPGSIYQRDKLNSISKKLSQLGFLKETAPWNLTLLGTGAKLNLYLASKQSSQIDLLIGLMPSNEQLRGQLLLTGEANMQLRNAFGGGESLLLNWQQIQVQSPRLQIGFQKPYLFKSNVGVDFQFNLFKKDSTFLTLNTKIGMQYDPSINQQVTVFFQQFSSSLLDVDTNVIKLTKRLPVNLDISTSNVGIDYKFDGTDNRFNPQTGFEWHANLTAGLRKIRPNNAIKDLKVDKIGQPFNFGSLYDTLTASSTQARLLVRLNRYQKIARQSTIKTGIQAGYIQAQKLFVNELFQIGGIKTLRGFDEESIFASEFIIATVEYRYLIGPSSYIFTFLDAAHAGRKSYLSNFSGNFLGAGLGLSFETKSGIFNLAYAAGKKPDSAFNFKESKIHFGFVSLF
jgi:outer membrane protein assembly factor BamA